MDTWKYKHPTPYDFMFSFNKVAGKTLTGFGKSGILTGAIWILV